MAVYQVRLVNPAIALDRTITVPDEYILDIWKRLASSYQRVPPRNLFCLFSKTGEW